MRRTLTRTRAPIFNSLKRDRATGGFGELGVLEGDAAQRAQQHIGHRGEPQPQLVGAHRLGRGTVGIEVELAFLDAVLPGESCWRRSFRVSQRRPSGWPDSPPGRVSSPPRQAGRRQNLFVHPVASVEQIGLLSTHAEILLVVFTASLLTVDLGHHFGDLGLAVQQPFGRTRA